jgi:hypothetical protein
MTIISVPFLTTVALACVTIERTLHSKGTSFRFRLTGLAPNYTHNAYGDTYGIFSRPHLHSQLPISLQFPMGSCFSQPIVGNTPTPDCLARRPLDSKVREVIPEDFKCVLPYYLAHNPCV